MAGAGHAGRPAPRAGRVIVYGRNPVREALRGPRTVARVWASDRAAREPWLREAGPRRADDAELESLCGSPDHQGVCAEVSEFEYAAAPSLLRDEDALVLRRSRRWSAARRPVPWSTCRWRGFATSRITWRTPSRRRRGFMEPRPWPAPCRTTSRTTGAAWSWSWAPRAAGSGPAWRLPATS
ncbi:MAG: hypothetical protein E6G07_00575 [Actinobacteria bacterium]|nr:MAG: hypothetical protein E6G07_00575 [Actinomycetota bacterium]